MVDDVPTDSCGAGSVKIDGCHLGGVVGHEEITVAGGEHRQQVQRVDAQQHTQWIDGAHGGCL